MYKYLAESSIKRAQSLRTANKKTKIKKKLNVQITKISPFPQIEAMASVIGVMVIKHQSVRTIPNRVLEDMNTMLMEG